MPPRMPRASIVRSGKFCAPRASPSLRGRMSAPLPQYLYLTTRGRRTGLARQIEIWFTERDGRYYVIAEHDTSHWLQNLRCDSRVQIRVGDSECPGRARALDPAL